MKLHKKLCYLLLCAVMLTGCSQNTPEEMPDIDTLRQNPETTAETPKEAEPHYRRILFRLKFII